jgi:hypothetical protein
MKKKRENKCLKRIPPLRPSIAHRQPKLSTRAGPSHLYSFSFYHPRSRSVEPALQCLVVMCALATSSSTYLALAQCVGQWDPSFGGFVPA